MKLIQISTGREIKEGMTIKYDGERCYIYELSNDRKVGLENPSGMSWDMIEPEDIGCVQLDVTPEQLQEEYKTISIPTILKKLTPSEREILGYGKVGVDAAIQNAKQTKIIQDLRARFKAKKSKPQKKNKSKTYAGPVGIEVGSLQDYAYGTSLIIEGQEITIFDGYL